MSGEIFPTDDEIKYIDLLPNGLKAVEVKYSLDFIMKIIACSDKHQRSIWRRSLLW